jgi:hypothetical protein
VKDSILITGNVTGDVTVIQGRLVADPPPTGYRCMAIPPERGFVEREELEKIRDILCGASASAVGITSALRGAGGFGKTTLAQALCHDDRVQAAYPDGILWTTIGDQTTEADRLSRILDLIRFWTPGASPHFDTVEAAAARLREILAGRRVLVVVDDAWSPVDVRPFRGAGAGLRRAPPWSGAGCRVPVPRGAGGPRLGHPEPRSLG